MYDFKVAIANDITTLIMTAQCVPHQYLGWQGFVPVGVAVDFPVPMYWPPGFALGSNKLSKKVLHKGLPIVLDGHDCGVCIPHLHLVPDPANVYTVIQTLLSSRKLNFFGSTEVCEGRALGIVGILNLPPAPMSACSDPTPVPAVAAPTTMLNSLLIDMPLVDALIGWCAVGARVLLDFAMNDFKAPKCDPSGYLMNKLGLSPRTAARQALAVSTGVARAVFTDGPADFKVTVGSPYAGIDFRVSRSADGEVSGGITARAWSAAAELGADAGGPKATFTNRHSEGFTSTEYRYGEQPKTESVDVSTDSYATWGAPKL